jgi:hypothetical protein
MQPNKIKYTRKIEKIKAVFEFSQTDGFIVLTMFLNQSEVSRCFIRSIESVAAFFVFVEDITYEELVHIISNNITII